MKIGRDYQAGWQLHLRALLVLLGLYLFDLAGYAGGVRRVGEWLVMPAISSAGLVDQYVQGRLQYWRFVKNGAYELQDLARRNQELENTAKRVTQLEAENLELRAMLSQGEAPSESVIAEVLAVHKNYLVLLLEKAIKEGVWTARRENLVIGYASQVSGKIVRFLPVAGTSQAVWPGQIVVITTEEQE